MKISVNLREILIFSSGLIVGAFSTVALTSKFFKKKAEDEAAEKWREAYEEVLELKKAAKNKIAVKLDPSDVDEETYKKASEGEKASSDGEKKEKEPYSLKKKGFERSTFERYLAGAGYDKVDYKSFYSNEGLKEENLEDLHPMDDGEEEKLMQKDSKKTYKDPKIISADSYGDMPGWENEELYYYKEDDVLVDSDDTIIENREYLIGNALTKYDFKHSDERAIYVRNEAISTDFMITKVDGAFE